MSGICGLLRLDGGPASSDDLQPAMRAMAHRGPDGQASWVKGSVALGHLALHTTPEAREEQQPLRLEARDLTLVFDGRIDERRGLREVLQGRGFGLRGPTDAELVLQAYACWGETCVEHLRGDFAFAVWDGREQRLFLARDIWGVRPLHVHHGPAVFAFGSEAGAVARTPGVPREPNPSRIADFLVDPLEWADPTGTVFAGITRLPHASSLTLHAERAHVRRYWMPDAERELPRQRDDAYAEGLREQLVAAVESRLRAEPAAASMLSGGVDSAGIVCLARDILRAQRRAPLRTFSMISDDESTCPEAPYIRAVLAGGHLQPESLHIGELGTLRDQFHGFIRGTDDPFVFGVGDIVQSMYALAGRAGVRTVFDGVDGDLVAGGGGVHFVAHALLRGRLHKALGQARSLGAGRNRSTTWALWYWGGRPLVPTLARITPRPIRRWLRRYRTTAAATRQTALAASVAHPDLLAATEADQRLETLRYDLWQGQPSRTPRERRAAFLVGPSFPVALSRYERAAAFYGVEPRHPLLDRRVTDYCLALPQRQRHLDGWSKSVLRRALRGSVPDRVRWRLPARNLSPATLVALAEGLRAEISDLARAALPGIETYVDVSRARNLIEEFERDDARIDHNGRWHVASEVLRLAYLGTWYDRWIHG